MTQQTPVLAYFHGKGPGLRAITEAGGDAMYWVQVGVLRGGYELRWGEDVVARVKSNWWRGMSAETALGHWEMRYRGFFSSRIEMGRTAGATGVRSPAGTFRRGFWGGGELVLAPWRKYRFKRRGIYRIGGDFLDALGTTLIQFRQEATFTSLRMKMTVTAASLGEVDLTAMALAGFMSLWLTGAGGTRGSSLGNGI